MASGARPRYFELHCKSNFSFLEGASHAHELVATAAELGYAGLAITDRDTLAGVVRAHTAAKDAKLRFLVGCELNPIDGPPAVVWPRDRRGYGQLCRLLSIGRLRAVKGQCEISWHDIADHCQDWILGLIPRLPESQHASLDRKLASHVMPCVAGDDIEDAQENIRSERDSSSEPYPLDVRPIPSRPWCAAGIDFSTSEDAPWIQWASAIKERCGENAYLLSHLHAGVNDLQKLERLQSIAARSGVPIVAAGACLYHHPERMLLHDCISAIASGTTIEQIARTRPANAMLAMQPIDAIARKYRSLPDALERTLEIADRIEFSLECLRYEYPTEWSPRA